MNAMKWCELTPDHPSHWSVTSVPFTHIFATPQYFTASAGIHWFARLFQLIGCAPGTNSLQKDIHSRFSAHRNGKPQDAVICAMRLANLAWVAEDHQGSSGWLGARDKECEALRE
jgi:hypothetical protein